MKIRVNHYAAKVVETSFRSEIESIAITGFSAIVCSVLSWYSFQNNLAHLLIFAGLTAIGSWIALGFEAYYAIKSYIEVRNSAIKSE